MKHKKRQESRDEVDSSESSDSSNSTSSNSSEKGTPPKKTRLKETQRNKEKKMYSTKYESKSNRTHNTEDKELNVDNTNKRRHSHGRYSIHYENKGEYNEYSKHYERFNDYGDNKHKEYSEDRFHHRRHHYDHGNDHHETSRRDKKYDYDYRYQDEKYYSKHDYNTTTSSKDLDYYKKTESHQKFRSHEDGERNYNRKQRDYYKSYDDNRSKKYFQNRRKERSTSVDPATTSWGKQSDKGNNRRTQEKYIDEKNKNSTDSKQKPNFALSGKLAEATNTYRGVVIKYSEPPEARKPRRRWRLYPFKGEKALQTLYIHRESAYLIGRDRKVVDLPADHPSCSKQHAVLQYRLVPFTRSDGSQGKRVRPYIIDLESANGTFLNNKKIDAKKYFELFEKDVLKFGFSTREYVLLHENSKDEILDDDVKTEGLDELPMKEESHNDDFN